MKRVTRTKVAQIVQSHVDRHQPRGFKLLLDPKAIDKRNGHWRAVVRPEPDVPASRYIDRVMAIEEEIAEQEQLKVLLLPVLAED